MGEIKTDKTGMQSNNNNKIIISYSSQNQHLTQNSMSPTMERKKMGK